MTTRRIRFIVPGLLAVLLTGARAMGQDGATVPEEPLTRPAEGLLFVGSAQNEPYSFLDRDGLPAGYDVELMQAVARKLGREVSIRLLSGRDGLSGQQRAEMAVAMQQADGLIALGVPAGLEDVTLKSLEDTWHFCGTLVREWGIVVRRTNRWVNRLEDLDGMRVAMVEHDPARHLLVNNRSITLDEPPQIARACLYVRTGLVAAMLADRNAAQYAARLARAEELKFTGQTVYTMRQYGPAVHRRYGQEPLPGEITRALQALEGDGTLAALRAKWFQYELNPTSFFERPNVVRAAWIIAAALVLAMTGLLWRLTMQRAVALRTRKIHGEMEVLRKQLIERQDRLGAPAPPAAATTVEAGPQLEAIDLNDFVHDALPALRGTTNGQASLSLQLADELPAVLADPQDVRAALVNLCHNARDAITARRAAETDLAGRIVVFTRLARPADLPPAKRGSDLAYVAIGVRDNGCGIAQRDVQKIFEAGYSTKPDAAGRGLSIVYSVAAAHGGWIDVESAPNRGTTMSLFLPAAV